MFSNPFNTRTDPVLGAVEAAMKEGELRRQAVDVVNEAFGVYNRNAIIREELADYDAAIEEVFAALKEGVQIDEVSAEKLGRYLVKNRENQNKNWNDSARKGEPNPKKIHDRVKLDRQLDNRKKGQATAVKKLVGNTGDIPRAKVVAKEDYEQIDEAEKLRKVQGMNRHKHAAIAKRTDPNEPKSSGGPYLSDKAHEKMLDMGAPGQKKYIPDAKEDFGKKMEKLLGDIRKNREAGKYETKPLSKIKNPMDRKVALKKMERMTSEETEERYETHHKKGFIRDSGKPPFKGGKSVKKRVLDVVKKKLHKEEVMGENSYTDYANGTPDNRFNTNRGGRPPVPPPFPEQSSMKSGPTKIGETAFTSLPGGGLNGYAPPSSGFGNLPTRNIAAKPAKPVRSSTTAKPAKPVGGLKTGDSYAGGKKTFVSAGDLKDFQTKNPGATLGQYMNAIKGKTAVTGGKNDPNSSNFKSDNTQGGARFYGDSRQYDRTSSGDVKTPAITRQDSDPAKMTMPDRFAGRNQGNDATAASTVNKDVNNGIRSAQSYGNGRVDIDVSKFNAPGSARSEGGRATSIPSDAVGAAGAASQAQAPAPAPATQKLKPTNGITESVVQVGSNKYRIL